MKPVLCVTSEQKFITPSTKVAMKNVFKNLQFFMRKITTYYEIVAISMKIFHKTCKIPYAHKHCSSVHEILRISIYV